MKLLAKMLYDTFDFLIRSKLQKRKKIKKKLTACLKIFRFAVKECNFTLL